MATSTMVEACASVSDCIGTPEFRRDEPCAAILLFAGRPIDRDRRAVARTPAIAARRFVAIGGALDQRQLHPARLALGGHGAEILEAGGDGEGHAGAIA